MLRFYGKMALVGVAHATFLIALYYGRVSRLSPVFKSDVLCFALPSIAALGAYFHLSWHYVTPKHRLAVKTVISLMLSLFALCISSLVAATMAFNAWGK